MTCLNRRDSAENSPVKRVGQMILFLLDVIGEWTAAVVNFRRLESSQSLQFVGRSGKRGEKICFIFIFRTKD